MIAWLSRLFAPKAPVEPEPPSLKRRVSDVERDVEYMMADLEKLRGRVTGFLRRKRQEREEEPPETLEPTIPEPPAMSQPNGTSHLSKRFRRF